MTSLDELRDRVRAFARERDWEQFHIPKNLAMALAGEAGELLAEFQWLTPEQSWLADDPERAARVRAEIADVLIYLIRLTDVLDVDLVEAGHAKLAEVELRYPAEHWRGRAGKSAGQRAEA